MDLSWTVTPITGGAVALVNLLAINYYFNRKSRVMSRQIIQQYRDEVDRETEKANNGANSNDFFNLARALSVYNSPNNPSMKDVVGNARMLLALMDFLGRLASDLDRSIISSDDLYTHYGWQIARIAHDGFILDWNGKDDKYKIKKMLCIMRKKYDEQFNHS